jgi:purine nucleosidase
MLDIRLPVMTAFLAGFLLSAPLPAEDQAFGHEYGLHRALIEKRDSSKREIPVIPPKDRKLRVLIDTDTGNEIDDIWAIALAMRCPERFQIEGFVAANYDNGNPGGGPQSIETSARLIEATLEKAGLQGKIPVKRGSQPMRYQFEPSESGGVDFIIKEAMASPPEDKLWIIGLGASTDIASAYLKEPRIAEHIVVFWHFRTEWPKRCWNFNVIGDVRAARIVYHSDLSFVLFDTGTHLTCPMEQSARWVDYNPLGRFVHEYRLKNKAFQSPQKGFFDLGDIAALADPSLATWEVVDCPEVNWDLAYQFKGTKGKILRCGAIDRDKTFALFEERLGSR